MILKAARQRYAQPAHDHGQLILNIFAISEFKRRLPGQMFENRP